MKAETAAELLQAFRDYSRVFKGEYLHRLVEQGTRDLLEGFQSRAVMVKMDFGNLLEQSRLEGEDRLAKMAFLSQTRELRRGCWRSWKGSTARCIWSGCLPRLRPVGGDRSRQVQLPPAEGVRQFQPMSVQVQ